MSLIKKKMKKAGKGTDKPESFRKEFDVLNYTPADISIRNDMSVL